MISIGLSLVGEEYRITIGDMFFFNFKTKEDALLMEQSLYVALRSVESIGVAFDMGRSDN